MRSVSAVPGAELTRLSCPHCDGLLSRDWPDAQIGRCPVCRLIIGAGRSRATSSAEARGPRSGRSAGTLVGAAHREECEPVAPELLTRALCEIADALGVDVARLRMVDYVEGAAARGLPSLGVVLATAGTWKAARLEARAWTRGPEPAQRGRDVRRQGPAGPRTSEDVGGVAAAGG